MPTLTAVWRWLGVDFQLALNAWVPVVPRNLARLAGATDMWMALQAERLDVRRLLLGVVASRLVLRRCRLAALLEPLAIAGAGRSALPLVAVSLIWSFVVTADVDVVLPGTLRIPTALPAAAMRAETVVELLADEAANLRGVRRRISREMARSIGQRRGLREPIGFAVQSIRVRFASSL